MELTIYSIVPILLFFMTSFAVLVYHILFITGQLKKIDRKVNVQKLVSVCQDLSKI